MSKDQKRIKSAHAGERIAKVMARVGLCSRRDAEIWIVNGRVSVNGKVLTSAAVNVGTKDVILVDGQPLPEKQLSRVWLYYKPKGLMTTAYDPEGRATVFDNLPADMPRVISIGRLDLNSEGLLLLTNDGELARKLELPTTAWIRRYRVRVNGRFDPKLLDGLKDGIEIDGVRYGPIIASFDRQQGANAWLNMALTEGKNREIRRICQHFGWPVSRLIRVGYGPFRLEEMEPGQVHEVKGKLLKEQLQFGNDYRHEEKADPDKAALEADNRRNARRERPAFDKGPDKRTREKNMPRSERPIRAERSERPARAETPTPSEGRVRNQRPGRNERMAREDGAPPRFERPTRTDKPSWDKSPRPGNRPEKPVRPARAEHASRSERPLRDERPRDDRAPRTERPARGERPTFVKREDRPERSERPAFVKREDRPTRDDRPRRSDTAAQGAKPSWSKRPDRDEQPVRQERARRNDRGARNEQAARSDAPKAGLKPGWAKNKPTKPQPGTGRKPDRDRAIKDERYARSERPTVEERPRKTFAKPMGDKPRSDKPRGPKPAGGKPGGKPAGDKPRSKSGGKPGSGNARRFR
nr:pseudouridine synthase [uncultured Dongia sp.]